ncbi:Exosome complex component CSL4 [Orchesella cincta]|uniref:Exosome complex component CSL4 n=1 Tax=Orchesella cincta TaxID=48709 RepID=A0A1D2NKX1_ORCCI|nr:Exosome complex component CSL4 [Orchesella cincta]
MPKDSQSTTEEEEYEYDPEEGVPVPKRLLYSDDKQKFKPKIATGTPCMPGQRICIANEYFEAGEGAYEFGDSIYASTLGFLQTEEFAEQELTVVSIKRGDGKPPFTAPYVGAVVTCIVLSRTQKLCRCLITHVGSIKLDDVVKGIIRREYIHEKHRDLSEVETSFGVGDTVLARIVGISDGDFIMATGEDSLGVATAISSAGYYMVPVGWTRMECPKTKETLPKKVAKIVQDKNVEYWHQRNLNSKKESDAKTEKA